MLYRSKILIWERVRTCLPRSGTDRMVTPDYYDLLQVAPHADAEIIQAAYRRLAAKWHPDNDAPVNAFAASTENGGFGVSTLG